MTQQPFSQEAALFRHFALAEVRKLAPDVYNRACAAAFARASVPDYVPDYVQTLEAAYIGTIEEKQTLEAQRDALLAACKQAERDLVRKEVRDVWNAHYSWDREKAQAYIAEHPTPLMTALRAAIALAEGEVQP